MRCKWAAFKYHGTIPNLFYKWILLFNVDVLRFLDNIETITTLRLPSYEHINLQFNYFHYSNMISIFFYLYEFIFSLLKIEFIKEKHKKKLETFILISVKH